MSNADPLIETPERLTGATPLREEFVLYTKQQLPPSPANAFTARFEQAAKYRRLAVVFRYEAVAAGGAFGITPYWFTDGLGTNPIAPDQRINPATHVFEPDQITSTPTTGATTIEGVLPLINPGGMQWVYFAITETGLGAPNMGDLELWLRAGG
jgi:hypothetical protein